MIGVESFLQHLKQAKRYSVHTLCAYQNDLYQFSQYLAEVYQTQQLHECNASMIRSWLATLMEQKTARTTINRKRSALRSYFKFSIQQGVREDNPMDKISSLKKERKLPVFVEEENLNRLFDQPLFEDSFRGCRDHLILLLLYSTGMRLSELLGIKADDIDHSNSSLKITGKGNKQRVVPLLEEVMKLLDIYLKLKQQEFGSMSLGRLLVTDKGKNLYPRFVYSKVNFYLGKVSTIRKKSPHVLRHSFATHMLNQGADLNAIKEILGHANLSATQVYTHNSFSKIRTVYKQAHPRA